MKRLRIVYTIIRVLVAVVAIALVATSSVNVHAQDTPENVREAAIRALNQAIPDIGRPDSWRHAGPVNADTSALGCTGAPGFALENPVPYYQVWLDYDGVEYLIHVTADATRFVYCDAKIPGSFNNQDTGSSNVSTAIEGCQLTSSVRIETREQPAGTATFNGAVEVNQPVRVIGSTSDLSWYQIFLPATNVLSWVQNADSIMVSGLCANVLGRAVSDVENLDTCFLNAEQANVRVEPSTRAAVVTILNQENIPVEGRTGDNNWYQVAEGWIATSVSTVTGNCGTLPITGVAEIDYAACPDDFAGYLPSRLDVGERGAIEEGGVANRVRQNPSTASEILFQLQPGSEFDVISGPQCGNGIVWWEIQTSDGRTGWTAESSNSSAEYFVSPLQLGINANGTVDANNVQFMYPVELATDIAVEVVDPLPPTEQSVTGGHNGYRQFSFLEYMEENRVGPDDAYIRVYPTETLFEFNEVMFDQWVMLSAELQDQTKYTSDSIISPVYGEDEPLPALPLRNAAQVFATQIRYVEFQNGVGIRYITRYSQAPDATANDTLFYTFQGLTYDNQFYVVAVFPISAAILPDTFDPEASGITFEDLPAIDLERFDQLARLNPADYMPDLSLLDEILASLNVQ